MFANATAWSRVRRTDFNSVIIDSACCCCSSNNTGSFVPVTIFSSADQGIICPPSLPSPPEKLWYSQFVVQSHQA